MCGPLINKSCLLWIIVLHSLTEASHYQVHTHSDSMSSTELQNSEIEALKAAYPGNCKVIKDVGDFTHVIDIKHENEHLALKFQLEGTYPSTTPNILVKSAQLTPEDKASLTDHLVQKSSELQGQHMLDTLYKEAVTWVEEKVGYTTCQQVTLSAKDNKTCPNKKKGKKSKGNKNTENETEGRASKKLASMKTATDVVSRILWDEQLHMEDFTVGYIDRFVGVLERSFSTFTWEDLASVDYDALAIPKHRIQYFKYKGLTVWDKESRMDNVFGSTGSGLTITDVIEKFECGELTADEKSHDPQVTGQLEDDEDEDIVITTGIEGEEGVVYPRDRYWGPKKRPTHFLCLRVTDPAVMEAVTHAQRKILEISPEYEEALMPVGRLHITLLCLGLDDHAAVAHATDTLHRIQPALQAAHSPKSTLTVTLSGTDHFFNKVLYARVQPELGFMALVRALTLAVQEAGVEIRDVFDFQPHMTLLKLKKPLQRELHTRYLDSAVYSALDGVEFGSQVVDNVYLCEMSEDRDEQGFYICPTHLQFHV